MAEKVEAYEKLLKDISLHAGELTKHRIAKAFERVSRSMRKRQ